MLMSLKTAKKVEAVGMLLVLCSIGWQVFLEDVVQDIALDAEIYSIDRKIDNLWMYVGQIGQAILHDKPTRSTSSYDILNEGWDWGMRSTDSVRGQRQFFQYVRGALFLIGSILTAVGRYYEITNRST